MLNHTAKVFFVIARGVHFIFKPRFGLTFHFQGDTISPVSSACPYRLVA